MPRLCYYNNGYFTSGFIMNCKHLTERGQCNYLTDKLDKHGYSVTEGFCNHRCKQNPEQFVTKEKIAYIQSRYNMPPKWKQICNAVNALGRAINSRFRYVSLLARDERFRICNKCPHLSNKLLLRCSKCGCALKLKTRLESEHCPIGKW